MEGPQVRIQKVKGNELFRVWIDYTEYGVFYHQTTYIQGSSEMVNSIPV